MSTTLRGPSPALVHRRATRRSIAVAAALAAAFLAIGLVSLSTGDFPLTPARVFATLTGSGEPMENVVMWNLRVPRLLLCLVGGGALALAGGLMQTLLRNPLASPDLMGISAGASLGAVAATTLAGWTGWAVTGSALAGAAVTVTALMVFARGQATTTYRFVIVGVGLQFLAQALIGYVIKRAQLNQAQSALIWTIGSINAATYTQVAIVAGVLALTAPLIALVCRPLGAMELGTDAASALGADPARTRRATLAIAVVLTAAPVALIGPVGFIALCSAPIARGLVGGGRLALPHAFLTGALLLAIADLLSGAVTAGSVPVGVLTGAVGSVYLLWLLVSQRGTHR